MSIAVILAIAGVVLVGLGILGGGVTGQFGFPRLARSERISSLIGGLLFLLAAYVLDRPLTPQQAEIPSVAATSTMVSETPSVVDTTQLPTSMLNQTSEPTRTSITAATQSIVTGETNTAQAGIGCNTMEEVKPHHEPQYGIVWVLEPYAENRIIEVWSNHHSNNLSIHLYFLPAGKRAEFMSGGGVEYRDRINCDFAAAEYERKKNNPRPPIDDAQYQAYITAGKIP